MRRVVYTSVLGLILLLTGCGQPAYPSVRLNVEAEGVVAAERAMGRLPLRVAIAAVISPKATFDTYSPLLDHLAKRLDRPVELLQRPSYFEINELLRTGQADVGFICGGAFVEGERQGYMELLVVPEMGGTTTYQASIIVAAENPYRSFDDLRGQRFAFTDPLSNSGRLYVQYRLAQMGETPNSYFGETIYTYSHDNAVRAVAQGIVDGATVDSLVFDALVRTEPVLGQRLRVVERSRPFGIPPVVVHPDLDPELKAAVQQALLNMHNDPEGREALRVLYVDRFVPADPDAYEDIRRMAAEIRGWR
ncbi:MAG: phosphate/phosphite/phosphonate ABC transporter substrate-binding protein [Anaerolineae bacterium]